MAIAQVGVYYLGVSIHRGREASQLPIFAERRSEPARDFVVEQAGGERQVVRASSGQFQLVHFWATWCPPCRKELPLVLDLAARDPGRLRVWAISTDPEWSTIRTFLKGDVPASVVRDPGGDAYRDYGVSGLPDSYLIDPSGRIRARFSGAQNWTSEMMDQLLERLMKES